MGHPSVALERQEILAELDVNGFNIPWNIAFGTRAPHAPIRVIQDTATLLSTMPMELLETIHPETGLDMVHYAAMVNDREIIEALHEIGWKTVLLK